MGYNLKITDIQAACGLAQLKKIDTLLDSYIHGISCKYCHNTKSAESKKRYADRQKQIDLAVKRGEKHIGKKIFEKEK